MVLSFYFMLLDTVYILMAKISPYYTLTIMEDQKSSTHQNQSILCFNHKFSDVKLKIMKKYLVKDFTSAHFIAQFIPLFGSSMWNNPQPVPVRCRHSGSPASI